MTQISPITCIGSHSWDVCRFNARMYRLGLIWISDTIRCLLSDDATIFIAVTALCTSFIMALMLQLLSLLQLFASLFQLAFSLYHPTFRHHVHACSPAVAPMGNYSTVALVHLSGLRISPQTKWSNQFVCHQSSHQWTFHLLTSLVSSGS